MPEKEARQSKAGAEIDFRALEVEIDREIDSLFVPSVHNAGKAKKELELDESSQINPEELQSSGELPAGLNLEALKDEIDKEIDSLFVPSAKPGWDEGPARIWDREEPQKAAVKPATVDARSLSIAREEGAPLPKASEAIRPGAKYNPPSDETFDSQKYQMQELSKLIETFNAAYLSVDWDLSQKNIQKLIVALNQLEPFASRTSESKSVYRIMDAILRRLHDRPHAVNSRLVQLIRDSQGLLAHMLLIDGNIGPHEKRRLRDLIERFQELRQRALAAKAGAKKSDIPSDRQGRMQAQTQKAEEPVAETSETCQKAEPVPQPSPACRENLCLMIFYGKCLALPVSCVLKVARSPGKKCQKILKRGFATLADFKPFLRGIKSGVLGEWANLDAEILKSYRFEPVGPLSPDQLVTGGPMAVLATDGQTHMIVFCEIVNFIADTEIIGGPQTDGTFGPFENKSHVLVPVFNPQSTFCIPDAKARKTADSSGGI